MQPNLLPFDLHLTECTAQAAAIWLVLKAILQVQLEGISDEERTEFFDRLLDAAKTITLPVSDDAAKSGAAEWIAGRHWQLIENFIASQKRAAAHGAPQFS